MIDEDKLCKYKTLPNGQIVEDFKAEFEEMYAIKNAAGYSFFNMDRIKLTDEKYFYYLDFNIDEDIYAVADRLATKKYRYIPRRNMLGSNNNTVGKMKRKALQGVLGEMAIHLFLLEQFPGIEVHRYDLERTNFFYSSGEYDLKICHDGKEYIIESKSTKLFENSLEEYVKNSEIIATFKNDYRMRKDYSDFHFRPIFTRSISQDFIDDLWAKDENKKVHLVITGCATRDEMEKYGHEKVYDRLPGVTYYVIDNLIAGDLLAMIEKIKPLVKKPEPIVNTEQKK